MTDWAYRIRSIRKEFGWTQEALAKKLGMTKGNVVLWETGKGFPYDKTLEKISLLSGKSMAWLRGESEFAASEPASPLYITSPRSESNGVTAADFLAAITRQQAQTDKSQEQTDRVLAMLEAEKATSAQLSRSLIAEREFQRKREERSGAEEMKAVIEAAVSAAVAPLLAKIERLEKQERPEGGSKTPQVS